MSSPGRPHSSRSFARDLTLGLSLTVFSVVILTVVVSFIWSTQRSLDALNQEADETAERIALTLAQPIWVINLQEVAQIGRLYSTRPNILYLRIEDDTGLPLFEGPNAPIATLQPDTTNAVHRHTPILFDGNPIGMVHLAMVNTTLVPQQRQYVSSVVLFSVVLTIATVLVLLTLVRRLLVRPFQALTQSLHRLTEGTYHHQVPRFGVIEMDNIGDAFNKMVEAVSTRDQALLETNASLEEQVTARTQKLQATNEALDQLTQRLEAQNALLEAQNMTLESQNAEMERFTYTVSHDLKSPLITIKGFMGLIQRSAQANDLEQLYQDLEKVNNAADQMHALLMDLLRLSRIGRQVNPFEWVSLQDVLDQTLSSLQGPIAECQAHIAVPSDLPAVWGDPTRIREVFQNLIENALKFTRPGVPPNITIEATHEEGGLHCVVRDEGIGIPIRYHDTIFGLFERLDTTIEGTGVGLALVKRIIELHEGKIWFEPNNQMPGTAFHFTFPDPPTPASNATATDVA